MLQDYLQAYVKNMVFRLHRIAGPPGKPQSCGNDAQWQPDFQLQWDQPGCFCAGSQGRRLWICFSHRLWRRLEAIAQVVHTATHHAAFLDRHVQRGQPDFPSRQPFTRQDGSSTTHRLHKATCLASSTSSTATSQSASPKLLSRRILPAFLIWRSCSTPGWRGFAFVRAPIQHLRRMTTQDKDGQPVELFKVMGGYGNFLEKFPNAEDLFGKLEKQYEQLIRNLRGFMPNPVSRLLFSI